MTNPNKINSLTPYCFILCSLFLFLFPPVCLSKTVIYDYNDFGYLRQAQTLSGPVIDYSYDPVGNRKTMDITPLDSDGDGLGNGEELSIYGTDPYLADTDGDGINDGDEVNYWNSYPGESWDSDIDGDLIINLLDPDSDNDGFNDGYELSRGTDPGDPGDYPPVVIVPILFMLLTP